MSRAYRIKVSETLRRVLKAADGVSTQLEILEILPREQMAELLEQELEGRGFEKKNGTLEKRLGGVRVSIDAQSGTVSVKAEACEDLELEQEKQGWTYDERRRATQSLEKDLRESARKELEAKADERKEELQAQVTDELEAQLGGLRKELDQVVNRVTAEALKKKAAQMGQIKELTEDPQSGSLTIVVEV